MDDFVCNLLTECDLGHLIEKFKGEGVTGKNIYSLSVEVINDLIPQIGPREHFKKILQEEKNKTEQETGSSAQKHKKAADSAQVRQVLPSTSNANAKRKRKSDHQNESSKDKPPTFKQRCDTLPESNSENILSDVRVIMDRVKQALPDQDNNKLIAFLRDKIKDLKTEKREVVGVFGKTGAGKSSLINAVIENEDLLASGTFRACTTAMIKVEANMQNSKYEADIEFITEEEWKDELFNFFRDYKDQKKDDDDDDDDDDDYRDFTEKLSALYGEEWKSKTPQNLMDSKYFREIPEFLNAEKKSLSCKSAKELSEKSSKYTRSVPEGSKGGKRFWPLVKCVTIRVPNNDLLRHVTLVDLPGSGDRNKSRDEMWKEVIGTCSTVWIVTDIHRAGDEKEAWQILRNACSLMGNGGECQHIHFICAQSDVVKGLKDKSSAGIRAAIFKRNKDAKEEVRKDFSTQNMIKKHFSDDCLEVFTVSSTEFLNKQYLEKDETEIPKLQKYLQSLNDRHSETLNYVSGAHGILSLIQATHQKDVADQKTDVCADLEEKMKQELDKIRKSMDEAYKAFEKCLSEGVEESKRKCDGYMKNVISPRGVSGRGFHKTLRCIVVNRGVHKTGKGKQINLNMKLASCLTNSIDEEFKKTFPNDRKSGPFNGVINTFSLGTERLTEKYKDVKLQLIFLKTEEEKIKTKLNKDIRDTKKTIYRSLTEKIEETMQKCYDEAAKFIKQDSLKNMRDTVEKHVCASKDTMFEQAKDDMLNKLTGLKEYVLKTLEETMQESIDLSLKTNDYPLPGVTVELAEVTKYYKELKGSPDEESLICDPPGPAAQSP